MSCALLSGNRRKRTLKVAKAKKYQLRGKMTNKGSKFHQNGSSDFWTSCPIINCNPLPSLQSCTSFSKYLFYLVLWDLFVNLLVYKVAFGNTMWKFLWLAAIVSLKEFWNACTYTCFSVKTSWLLLQVFQENKPQEFCIRSLQNTSVLMPCSWTHMVQVKLCHTVIVHAFTLLWHFALLYIAISLLFTLCTRERAIILCNLSCLYLILMQVIKKCLVGVLFLCNNYLKVTLLRKFISSYIFYAR